MQLVERRAGSDQWLHEIKFDGYRLHAPLRPWRRSTLLTRTGLDWTHKYPAIAEAVAALGAASGFISTANCAASAPTAFLPFSRLQAASDVGSSAGLVLYLFDLLISTATMSRPAVDRPQERLADPAGEGCPPSSQRSCIRQRPRFLRQGLRTRPSRRRLEAARLRLTARNRGFWRKSNACTRGIIIVGWTEPEGRRPWLGAVLLAYYGHGRPLGPMPAAAGTGFR